jgi:hypothetical protein
VNVKGGLGLKMDTPLAPLEEVTLDNLAYDVEDVRRLKVGGCGGESYILDRFINKNGKF